jgi:hypothetical protein
MTTLSIAGKTTIFHYGFVASNTAILLEKLKKREKEERSELDDECRKTINAAESFIDKALNGQQLIAGEISEGFAPSIDGIEAFRCAINTIFFLQPEKYIDKEPETQEAIREIFIRVKNVLDNILKMKQNDPNDFSLSEAFFSIIADGLLENNLKKPNSYIDS